MDKYSIDSNKTYILGIALIIDALKRIPKEIFEIYLSSNVNETKEFEKLISLCKKNNIPYYTDDKIINTISTKENCYGIAVINKFVSRLNSDMHFILKDFNDEGELGTIIRSLASFNFSNLVLINSNIDIYNPKVIRSSMGGYFYVNIVKFDTLDDYIKSYNNEIITIGLNGKKELKELKYKKNMSILVDNFNNTDYYIEHNDSSSINNSSLSTIVLNYIFNQI